MKSPCPPLCRPRSHRPRPRPGPLGHGPGPGPSAGAPRAAASKRNRRHRRAASAASSAGNVPGSASSRSPLTPSSWGRQQRRLPGHDQIVGRWAGQFAPFDPPATPMAAWVGGSPTRPPPGTRRHLVLAADQAVRRSTGATSPPPHPRPAQGGGRWKIVQGHYRTSRE
jgi:hypothetical protein